MPSEIFAPQPGPAHASTRLSWDQASLLENCSFSWPPGPFGHLLHLSLGLCMVRKRLVDVMPHCWDSAAALCPEMRHGPCNLRHAAGGSSLQHCRRVHAASSIVGASGSKANYAPVQPCNAPAKLARLHCQTCNNKIKEQQWPGPPELQLAGRHAGLTSRAESSAEGPEEAAAVLGRTVLGWSSRNWAKKGDVRR